MTENRMTYGDRWFRYAVFLCLISTLLALVEIQIEGPQGWSVGLRYVWRPHLPGWLLAIWHLCMGGDKSFDGYHLLMNGILVVFFHLPWFAGMPWSLRSEGRALSGFLVIGTLWDYLWFVWNPWYGLARFDAAHVAWHKSWTLGLPTNYWWLPVSLVGLAALTHLRTHPRMLLAEFGYLAKLLLFSLAFALLSTAFTAAVVTYH